MLTFSYRWQVISHLILTEQVFLPEGEQDDVSVVGRVFNTDVVRSVLQHPRCLIDDPVRAKERQQQAAGRPRHVNTHVHSHVDVRVTGERHGEEFWHFPFNPNEPVPVTSLIPHQHQ